MTASARRTSLPRVATLAIALGIWFSSPPDPLNVQAWRLFAIFAATIFAVVVGALPRGGRSL